MTLSEIPISTPSLLFPAISLLMLAYTNRFLALATIIRNLHASWRENHDPLLEAQISNLRRRIVLIRNMQTAGVVSLIACTISMVFLFFSHQLGGQVFFFISLIFMIVSLSLTLNEVVISGRALDMQLSDMEPKA
ncbi:uncharacterized protein DUF2721 [Prosthecobacter fusiformis]|uniref:Uncharacterized protein DUF2721 n=1 Tax=Prosthecobacter fusiformis TaxID=48464 RepID=A0A4R7SQN8_9BACT|nr:DUF2721 domain-containing protein [Prosthecobacter fusiformis]TDU81570.1 uncharacterized protein DUF2721 [Prosthecobacter fusiformis]